MDWFVRQFVKASLVWFGLGTTLGLGMTVHPEWLIYRPAHLHLNLLGFVAMMIYGVAYHVMPRFTGHPLHSPRVAGAHWWVANAGLVLLATGFTLAPRGVAGATAVLTIGAGLSAAGAYAFIWNLWLTLERRGPVARPPSPPDLVGLSRGERRPRNGGG